MWLLDEKKTKHFESLPLVGKARVLHVYGIISDRTSFSGFRWGRMKRNSCTVVTLLWASGEPFCRWCMWILLCVYFMALATILYAWYCCLSSFSASTASNPDQISLVYSRAGRIRLEPSLLDLAHMFSMWSVHLALIWGSLQCACVWILLMFNGVLFRVNCLVHLSLFEMNRRLVVDTLTSRPIHEWNLEQSEECLLLHLRLILLNIL